MHSLGKRNTQHIERGHLTVRTCIKRVVRKTIYFSKTTQMHDIVIGLFVNNFCASQPVSGRHRPRPCPVTRLAWAHGLAYTLHGRRTVSRGLPAVGRRRALQEARPNRSLQPRRPPMAETPTFGRYAEIPYEQMTPEQQEGYRSLIETRGRLPGPNKIYVHNPKLAKVMGPLGAHFRTGYSLSEREREIAVCIITSKFHAAYPTNAHERAAKAAGLPPDTVEAILSGLPTSFADPREQVVYEMATCLANARWVSKGLYDRAVDALGHVGITDVITLMGFYASVAMTLAFYDVPAGATGMER